MSENLSSQELINLIKTVFSLKTNDRNLAIIVDIPDTTPDNAEWQKRRTLVQKWFDILQCEKQTLNLESVNLFYYKDVKSNNADLPKYCFEIKGSVKDINSLQLVEQGQQLYFEEILAKQDIVLTLTQFSTTAPLKVLAKKHGFRAATMPGFSAKMIPALRLDWELINQRVNKVKELLDKADLAKIEFLVCGTEKYSLQLDLRYRQGHASGGLFPDPGFAGNLPSGESYIVPYEGEKGESSRSEGILPVQFGNEIVKYQIKENKAINVISDGKISQQESEKLKSEPAYGNIAELGFGVLRPFGIKPIGSILLDEKLGLHIAFGRSDHFGGIIGVKNFNKPENVIHIDRIYIPENQPDIQIKSVLLEDGKGETHLIIKNDKYTIFDE